MIYILLIIFKKFLGKWYKMSLLVCELSFKHFV